MKIIVCDDEPAVRQQIRTLLKIRYGDTDVILKQSGQQVVENPAADLIMLDIQMDEMNGIETAKKIRAAGIDTPIIFITALKDYVYDAFDVGAFWYLQKPIEKEQFYHVCDKAKKEILKRAKTCEEVLIFETKKRKYSIRRSDILYLESIGKKIFIHTYTEIIELYASMKEMEEKLGDAFFRCHRGYLVNMGKINSYSAEGIEVMGGDMVYLARDRYRDFVNSYMRYLGGDR